MTDHLKSLSGLVDAPIEGVSRERIVRDGMTNIGTPVLCECGRHPMKAEHEPQPIADQVKETFICECGVKTIRLLSIHY